MLVPYLPTSLTAGFKWFTDILPAPEAEQRLALWAMPEVTLTLVYDLVGDFGLIRQSIRALLFSQPAVTFEIPLRYEGLVCDDSVSGGVISVDPTLGQDWLVVGRRVYVEENEDENGYAGTIVGVGLDTVTIDAAPDNPTSATATRIFPLVTLLPTTDPSLGRHRAIENGKWTLTGTIQTFGEQGLYATADLYANELVWDRPALQNTDEMAEGFDRNLDLFGTPLTYARSLYAESRIRRQLSFAAGSDLSEWLWYKQMMFELRGQQGVFWRPTFRPDLVLAEQPGSTATSLRFVEDPSYLPWFDSGFFNHLELTLSDDTQHFVEITEVMDEMVGTHLAQLSEPFARGAEDIVNVSFLERTRLGEDVVTLTHVNGNLIITLSTLVGPWT